MNPGKGLARHLAEGEVTVGGADAEPASEIDGTESGK
jgi:hypothetical protein